MYDEAFVCSNIPLVPRLVLVDFARSEDAVREVWLVDGIWEVLCLQAEGALLAVHGATLANQGAVGREEVAYMKIIYNIFLGGCY